MKYFNYDMLILFNRSYLSINHLNISKYTTVQEHTTC
jgi:hypothetical protein